MLVPIFTALVLVVGVVVKRSSLYNGDPISRTEGASAARRDPHDERMTSTTAAA